MLEGLREGLRAAVDKLLGRGSVDEGAIKEFVRDVQRALLAADVNVNLVLDLSRRLEQALREQRPPPGISMKEHAIYLLYNEITRILGGEDQRPPLPSQGKPLVLMLVGLQGSGKTTAAGKLALYYKRKGHSPALISADTYRPGAYEQLRQLADSIGVPAYGGRPGDDALEVVREGLRAVAGADVVIVDTAGRHKEERELLEEMKELEGIVRPGFTFLIIDATIGQQAERQARAFGENVKIGGIIVTKLDSAARGGGALTAAAVTGAKVYFTSYGERLEDFEEYSPRRFAGRLLGMGDLESLLEKVRREAEASAERAERISRGKFTLEDFVSQLEGLRKMGPFSRLLEMLPGAGRLKVAEEDLEVAEDKVKRWRAAIDSMTPEERENPELLNGQRLRRVARGAGIDERDVKELLRAYEQARKLAKALRKSRARGLPGLGA